MNKFKKILLGALSVLTLGLFVVTGTKANAKGSVETNDIFTGNFNNMSSKIKTLEVTSSTSSNKMTFTTVTGKDSVSGVSNTYNTDGYDIDFSLTSGAATFKAATDKLSFTTTNNWSADVYYAFLGSKNGETQGIQTNIGTISVPENSTTKNILYKATISSGTSGNVEISRIGSKETVIYEIVVTQKNVVNTYDISYVSAHGTAPSKAVDKTSLSASELPTLENDGNWVFEGWYLDSEFTTAATTSTNLDNYDDDGDVTLYANWVNSAAKYTVTFNSNGGSAVSSVDIFYDENGEATLGNNMPANPTKTGYRFAGWYTSGDVRVLASTVLKADTTLYAKWVAGTSTNVFFDDLATEYAALPGTGNAGWDNDKNIAFNDYISFGNVWNGSYKNNDGETKACEYSAKGSSSKTFSDSTKFTTGNYVQCQNVYLTLTKTTKVTIYATQTSDQDRQLVVYNGANAICNYVMSKKGDSTVDTYSVVLSAGTYNLKSYKNDLSAVDGYANFYGVKLDEFAATPSVEFNCQYDTKDPSQATKIRFIATMDGIVDPLLIDSITFTATVGGEAKEFKCTQLYSSLSNKYSELGSGDGRYYASYAIRNIQGAITSGASFTSLSVTVKFTAASGLESITANHAGFTIGTTGA